MPNQSMTPEQMRQNDESKKAGDRETINIHRVSNGFIVGFPGHRMVFTDATSMLKALESYFKAYKSEAR